MVNHPNRSQSARKIAEAAGYYIREGTYQDVTENKIGRWYFGHEDDPTILLGGTGYTSRGAAWEAAGEHAQRTRRQPAG